MAVQSRFMRVQAIRPEAEGVSSYELSPIQDECLPPVEAGAHIDLHLPNGLVRSYSLCNKPGETHRYVVAVSRDAASRGGSVYLHDQVRVAEVVQVTGPRNNFALDLTAPHTVLVAGGIGITPIYAMAQRLQAMQASWELHYAARSRRVAAFVAALRMLAPDCRVRFHFDDEHNGQTLPLEPIVSHAPVRSHFYCCGPGVMLAAFEEATAQLPRNQVHVEYFRAPVPTTSGDTTSRGNFEVKLARSGLVLNVSDGKSILDAILDAGVDVPYSCMEGTCGSCEVSILEGEVEHRDSVLTAAQRSTGKSMMICCSRARSSRLVLDV
jgi:ferredoxin-NADP reductase